MPSVEVLKQLLDEFVEKEALINEELKVVNEQIDELHKRLNGCRFKLETIGADREKLIAMQARYAGFQLKKESDKVQPRAAKRVKEKRLINDAPEAIPEIMSDMPTGVPQTILPPVPQSPVKESQLIDTSGSSLESLGVQENLFTNTFSQGQLNLMEVWQTQSDDVLSDSIVYKEPAKDVEKEDKSRATSQPKKTTSHASLQSLLDLSSEQDNYGDPDTIDKTLGEALKSLFPRQDSQ